MTQFPKIKQQGEWWLEKMQAWQKAHEMWVVFYTERRSTGEPCQQWAEGVFLYDHWEVCETETEAQQRYAELLERDTTHSAGIGPITQGTDHWC